MLQINPDRLSSWGNSESAPCRHGEASATQTRPCPKNRLSISRLGVVHRRLNGCNGAGNDIAQHRQPVLNGDLSDWTILQASSGAFRKSWFEDRGFFLSVTGRLLSFIRG